MMKRSDEMKRWWRSVESLRAAPGVEIAPSIDQFLESLRAFRPEVFTAEESCASFLDALFEFVFAKFIRPILSNNAAVLDPPSNRLFRGFVRWMTGQLAIFSKFHFVPESQALREEIMTQLLSFGAGDRFSLADADAIRVKYESYLQFLVSRNFITPDDQVTFSEGAYSPGEFQASSLILNHCSPRSVPALRPVFRVL